MEYDNFRIKYFKVYDDIMDAMTNPFVNLSKTKYNELIIQSIRFWEGKKLKNIAFSIMPSHVHWIFELFCKDLNEQPVYLQDIMKSVKQFSSNQINKLEKREGALWQKESFDTTIRDEEHLYFSVNYVLNNPVKAGFVLDWRDWPGTWNGYGEIYD
jgi:REP element-mobilizing transposase RayT